MLRDKALVKIFLATPNIYTYYTFSDLVHPTDYSLVGWSATVDDAFRSVAEKKPALVIIDIMFNNFDIGDFLYGLKAINPELKIVLLGTPYQLNTYLNSILQIEFEGIMFKPVQEHQALNVLGALIPPHPRGKNVPVKILCKIMSDYFNEVLLYSSRRLKPTIVESILRAAKHERLDKAIQIEMNENLVILPRPYVRFERLRITINEFYKQIVRTLNQRIGPQVTFSLLQEAYQTFYPKSKILMESIEFTFPEINGFALKFTPLTQSLSIQELTMKDVFGDEEQVLETINQMSEQKFNKLFMRENLRKDVDVYLVLSAFDDIKGPTAVIVVPTPKSKVQMQLIKTIPPLLDFTGVEENEPFIHASTSWGTINVLFTIENKSLRGKIQENLLSVLVTNLSSQSLALLSRLSQVMKAAVAELKEILVIRENHDPTASLVDAIVLEYLNDFHSDLTIFFKEKLEDI